MADETGAESRVYEAIQKGIADTDGISFKLLSIVPLVSGTGLLTVAFGDKAPPVAVIALLSLFAATITLGIFWWELRNIQTCRWYLDLARDLDKAAVSRLPPQRFDRPAAPGGVGKTNAAKIVYATTIAAWLLFPVLSPAFWAPPFLGEGLYVAAALAIAAETIRAIATPADPGAGRRKEAGRAVTHADSC